MKLGGFSAPAQDVLLAQDPSAGRTSAAIAGEGGSPEECLLMTDSATKRSLDDLLGST